MRFPSQLFSSYPATGELNNNNNNNNNNSLFTYIALFNDHRRFTIQEN